MLGIYFSDVLFKLAGAAFMPIIAMLGLSAAGGDDDEKRRKRKEQGAWKTGKAAMQSLVDAPFGGLLISGDIASAVTDHYLSKAGHAAGLENAPRMFEVSDKLLPSFTVVNDAVLGLDKLTAGDVAQAADYAIQTCSEFAGAPWFSVSWDAITDALPDAIDAEDLSPAERLARSLTFSRTAIGAPKKKAQ